MKLRCFLSALTTAALLSASAGTNDWMSQLPGEAPVRSLSIPGAHDAATGQGFSSGSAFLAAFSGVTQKLPVAELWDNGIRAFDLRPTFRTDARDRLHLYHGVLQTKISMREAMQTIVDKLKANPSEFAILIIRHEDDSDDSPSEWENAMSDLFEDFESYIATFSADITVSEARGKMIVLTRDKFTSSKAGIISGWNHNENFADQQGATIAIGRNRVKLYVQDFYECGSVERKTASFSAMQDYALASTDDNVWVINHTSGYTGSMGTNSAVNTLAAGANSFAINYLDSREPGRTGIVLMDFAGLDKNGTTTVSGAALTNRIIAQNSLYLSMGAIGSITVDKSVVDDSVFTITGVCLGKYSEIASELTPGLYIIGGKKTMIR